MAKRRGVTAESEGSARKPERRGARADFNMLFSHGLCVLTTHVALCVCRPADLLLRQGHEDRNAHDDVQRVSRSFTPPSGLISRLSRLSLAFA